MKVLKLFWSMESKKGRNVSKDRQSLQKEFLEKLQSLRQHTNRGYRAPHKPLLLLIAFARIIRGENRLVNYSDCEEELFNLLREFGHPRKLQKPFEPFKRLPNDNIWELVNVPNQSSSTIEKLTGKNLKALNAQGGLLDKYHSLLRDDRIFLFGCIHEVLLNNFPLSYHSDVLQAVGVHNIGFSAIDIKGTSIIDSTSSARRRDKKFRKSILEIYESACSVCGSTVRIGDKLMGLEAAHIKWHAHGGPDEESNGLALCSYHHKAFDRGVIGLNNIGDGYKVKISEKVNGSGPALDWLRKFDGERIFQVNDSEHQPSPEFVDWHENEVFRN